MTTFADLGLNEDLQKICTQLGWTAPTKIQQVSIPPALKGNDIAGHAETGSGKTAAYILPIVQQWLEAGQPKFFALVLTPTRELALQVESFIRQLSDLSGTWRMNCLTLIGGVSLVEQQCRIGLQQHNICLATPGRLVEHIESSNGFVRQMHECRVCVLDEADRMLGDQFADAWLQIKKCLPRDASRLQTMLFSATLSAKVEKLRKSSLHANKTVFAEASESRYAAVQQLREFQLDAPFDQRELFLYHLVRLHLPKEKAPASNEERNGGGVIVFCSTCSETERLTLFLRNLFIRAVALNGRMAEKQRVKLLSKFARGERDVLVCTDVAARGLDIPSVAAVINFNVPDNVKDYQHRVGRTARAGRSGIAVTMVTHVEEATFRRIETLLAADGEGRRIPPLGEAEGWRPCDFPAKYTAWCAEAIRLAMKELGERKRHAPQLDANQEDLLEEYSKIANRSSNTNHATPPTSKRRKSHH